MDRNYRYKDYETRREPYSRAETSYNSNNRYKSKDREPTHRERDIPTKRYFYDDEQFNHEIHTARHSSRQSSSSQRKTSNDRNVSPREYRHSKDSGIKKMNSYEDAVNTPIISPIVIVKNLPCYVDEVALKLFITQQGFYAENIRLEKQIETGFPVFHGYVTFPNAIVAQSWFNVNQGAIKFVDGFVSNMEFDTSGILPFTPNQNSGFLFPSSSNSIASQEKNYEKKHLSYIVDWICIKCTTANNKARLSCFKCGITKEFSDDLEAKGYGLAGSSPCQTLLVQGIPEDIERRDISLFLDQYRAPMAECIHLADSKRFCLIEMKNFEDAVYTMELFDRVAPYINGQVVNISYSKVPLDVIFVQENMKKVKNDEISNDHEGSLGKRSRKESLER
uniref:RanBP2-type domain-containing protein n=1 Tax=Acrobeloides nanus TaxID=290746 RepID=A0A914CYH1_9BILA